MSAGVAGSADRVGAWGAMGAFGFTGVLSRRRKTLTPANHLLIINN